ncbi:hypothetical protein WUBG_17561 [Wuchereria bancrofti]|uniref:Uncharacterized protein n=1 Tax=Wuchereria bancrofti TaxID=6293 RepID=J9E872_WUCBA|nr:hypothetical protein WUBG_17561 [Wuchereria bancrofti]
MTVMVELIILLSPSTLFCRSNFRENDRFGQIVGLIKCKGALVSGTNWKCLFAIVTSTFEITKVIVSIFIDRCITIASGSNLSDRLHILAENYRESVNNWTIRNSA